jgi:hypothetical protein
MADRTSAAIFSDIFSVCANDLPLEQGKDIARKFWPKTWDYDFSLCQMEADEDLIKLGLAELRPHPKYPDEETIFYATRDCSGFE